MFAAKAGKSTIGIPKSVGSDFVAADQGGKLPQYVGDTKKKLKRRALAGTKPKSPVDFPVS